MKDGYQTGGCASSRIDAVDPVALGELTEEVQAAGAWVVTKELTMKGEDMKG